MRITEADHAALLAKRSVNPQSSGVKRWQALGRLPAGTLNNTEKAFAAYLQERQAAGAILWWKAHPFSVKIAANTHYRPDFIYLQSDMQIVLVEVKGGYTSDKGQMKIKLCAEALPVFKMVKVIKGKGGAFTLEEF